MSIQEGVTRWAETRSLLRRNKRSEYLDRAATDEERFTKLLIGALLEFGRVVDSDRVDVAELVEKFLQEREIESNLAPNFQWERECLKLTEVEFES